MHGNDKYKIEVLAFSQSSYGGKGSVKLRVNGEITAELGVSDSFILKDGKKIMIMQLPSSHSGNPYVKGYLFG